MCVFLLLLLLFFFFFFFFFFFVLFFVCFFYVFSVASGVLLSAVNRTDFDEGNNAFLLVLDAKTMKEIARADFNVPRFPRDFHGLFYSNGN